MAHELRTPLTALVAEASLLEGRLDPLAPDARRAAELLVADVRRLRVLVDDLMEISRFDAGAERPVLEPVDLGRVVTGAVAARLPAAVVSLPAQPLVVDSDTRRLDRILGNLLDNAREHAPGAPVEVALQATRDGPVIVVADRGPGVPADAHPTPVRAVLEGRPVAGRRQLRPGPRDRRRARGAPGRRAPGPRAAGGRARGRPEPAGHGIVTRERSGGDEHCRCWRRLATRTEDRAVSLPSRRFPVAIVVALLAALLVAACAPTAGPLGTPASPAVSPDPSEPPPSDLAPESPSLAPTPTAEPSTDPSDDPSGDPSGDPTSSPTASPEPTESPAAAGTTIVRAYFVLGSFTGNEGLVPVLREVPETRAVAAAAMRELLHGPEGAELEGRPAMYSAIPEGTRLLGIEIDGSTATVDLSGAFASGGGSAGMLARLGQVVYTLTQFSTVDKVRFQLDGEPVTTFGAEGIVLDGAVNRADFRELLPAIFVDRPAWGAAAGNPARVSGIANVFEATLQVELLDGRGNRLARDTVTATCGTGCWGTFRTDLAYDIDRAQYGTLRVYAESAKDGSRRT